MIDLYTTRRNYHNKCWYWKVDSKNKIQETLLYETKPSGFFYAKEENSSTFSKNVIGSVFQVGENLLMISTKDSVSDLRANDIVEFKKKKWIVNDIQRKNINKQNEYSLNNSAIYYIALRSRDERSISSK